MATPSDVSEQLGIPPATLRRYVSLFGDWLSAGARRARGREFSEADVEVLGQIRALFAAGQSLEQVRAALGGPSAGPSPAAEEPVMSSAEPPSPAEPAVSAEAASESDAVSSQADVSLGEEEEAEAPGFRPAARQFRRVQPVRSSLEARKMAADPSAADLLSQRLALTEDRIMTSNERIAVLEARIARLEEWVRMPWYRRLFSRPPGYGL